MGCGGAWWGVVEHDGTCSALWSMEGCGGTWWGVVCVVECSGAWCDVVGLTGAWWDVVGCSGVLWAWWSFRYCEVWLECCGVF